MEQKVIADNYIERQYEEYEARKAAWEKARKFGKKKKTSKIPTRQPKMNQEETPPEKEDK